MTRPFVKLFGPPEDQVLVVLDEVTPSVNFKFLDPQGAVCSFRIPMDATTSGELAARMCFLSMTEPRARFLIEQALNNERNVPDYEPFTDPRIS